MRKRSTSESNSTDDQKELFQSILVNNFITRDEELDQFKQNDEKIYDGEDEE